MPNLAKPIAPNLARLVSKNLVSDKLLLFGLRNISTLNYYATPTPGGEPGNATSFGGVILFQLLSLNLGAGNQLVFGRTNPSDQGWAFYLSPSNLLRFYARNGANTTIIPSNGFQFTASDVGQIFAAVGYHDGTNLRLALSRDFATPPAAITGYTAANAATVIGSLGAGTPASSIGEIAQATFAGVPTNLSSYFDSIRALRDLPGTPDGTTPTFGWSLQKALAGSGIVDGQIGPAVMDDLVTDSASHRMVRFGSPTTYEIDLSAHGRKSYGVLGFSATNRFESPGASPILGELAGFDIVGHLRLDRALAVGEVMTICSTQTVGFISGYFLRLEYSGASAAMVRALVHTNDVGGFVQSNTLNIPLSMIGVNIPVAFSLGASGLSVFANDSQSTPVAVSAFNAGTGKLVVGNRANNDSAMSAVSLFGLQGGNVAGGITLDQFKACALETSRTGRLASISGATSDKWDFTSDVVANGGPTNGAPTQVENRIGTTPLQIVGSDFLVAQRIERLFSWEKNSIQEGASAFTPTSRYEQPNGFGGHADSYFWQMYLRFDSQDVVSRTRILVSNYIGSSEGGFLLYSYGKHETLQAVFVNGAGSPVAPSTITITNLDIGKGMLITGMVDNIGGTQTARLWARRQQMGAGISISGSRPRVGGTLLLGEANSGGDSDGITIFGFQYGIGTLSASHIYANHDATLVENDIVAIPNRSTGLFSLKQSIRENGGVLPLTLEDRIGSAHMSRVGTGLTVAQQKNYAHTW